MKFSQNVVVFWRQALIMFAFLWVEFRFFVGVT